jgi:hypothetical protein
MYLNQNAIVQSIKMTTRYVVTVSREITQVILIVILSDEHKTEDICSCQNVVEPIDPTHHCFCYKNPTNIQCRVCTDEEKNDPGII